MVKLYDAVKAVTPDAPFARLSRVIAFSKDKLGVWLIPVTHGESSYAPRPFYCLRATLEQAMGANKVMVTEWAVPALWLMSDRVIEENAPKRADGRCPALEKRDADWAMIEKLVTQRPIAQILDHRMSYRWVLEIAKQMKVSIKRIYRSIHRYWAGGCNRNALLPLVTIAGLSIPGLIGGSFVIETIFSWPGIGMLGYTAIMQRDYPVQLGIALMAAVVVLFATLVTDLAYAVVDPRIRYE